MATSYPPARRADTADVLHGVRVPDPYRWLEHSDAGETRAWVDAQNALTRSLLDGPSREAFIERLTQLFNVPRSSSPLIRGRRRFFAHNTGLQDHAIVYVEDVGVASARPLIDPNEWSADATTALTGIFPSDDGRLVAYAVSHAGSDRQELRIRDAATGTDLPDVLQWVKFASIAWTPGGYGFYYLRFPGTGSVAAEDEQYHGRIYFHQVGLHQSDDVLVFEYPDDKTVVPLVNVTADGSLVVITCQRGASDDSEIYLLPAITSLNAWVAPDPPRHERRPLFTGFDAAYEYIGSVPPHRRGLPLKILFRTTKDTPMGRIIAVTPGGTIETFVPEAADRLGEAAMSRTRIAAVYLSDASSEVRLFDRFDGTPLGEVPLPEPGTVTSIDADPHGQPFVLAFTSFARPSTAYVFDRNVLAALWRGPSTPGRTDVTTTQVWYPSRDGTRVPMFLVHRGDIVRDGRRPVLLSGYGGFNISRTPQFDPGIFPLLERGGIFALANLRGGGEYGETWHRAGMLDRKQNVFDDFIAAAEFLVADGYSSPPHIAIEGGSNGGLLVGAVMVQRPDLFGAVVCRVPVADMLRYHLFTVGRFWIPEYGSADDPAQFAYLLRYSPYHNVRPGVRYPPALVMTADTDDRVDPGMAKKFAARLQADGEGGPFLLRVETRAGHGAGKPVRKLIEEGADILAFLERYVMQP